MFILRNKKLFWIFARRGVARPAATAFLSFILLFLGIFSFFPARPARAASWVAVPAVIDEKGHARDILKDMITLRNDGVNDSGRTLFIYATVKNIDSLTGNQNFIDGSLADKSISLANWIEISRGIIQVAPGAHADVPLTIQINPDAKVGNYHALISFGEGSTRTEAEQSGNLRQVMLNVEVQDDAHQRLNLVSFSPAHPLYFGFPAALTFTVQNGGNRTEIPGGEIIIYNQGGAEVASLPVNAGQVRVLAGQTQLFTNLWNAPFAFGKYRAALRLEYGGDGGSQPINIQDTAYVTIFPWQLLLILLAIIIPLIIFTSYFIHQRQLRKFEPDDAVAPLSASAKKLRAKNKKTKHV